MTKQKEEDGVTKYHINRRVSPHLLEYVWNTEI